MILHLAFVLPGAFLAVFQFIPLIRYRALIFHRVNGYLVLLLLTAGTIPGFLLSPHAFGGHISTASGGITIGVGTLVSLGMAYYNIKLLQIDQHRKWMLRAMVYMSAIITSRMMLGIGMAIMTSHPAPPFEVWPCGQLEWTVRDSDREVSHAAFVKTYPTCTGKDKFAMARAGDYGVEGFGSALRISFGTGLWIAMVLHAVGAEVYIRLTAGESERLRVVSWERQMERGWKNAGSVGSTGDRWGDAPKWVPERVGLVEK
ncbi:hypothetical protein BJ508DRAFT_20308 [Ascobolus immersus RN42]|uniref:Uncharacterized protein n=1 Tax=Ascobolus immersus RN42 TaxID=1160509 RepID=A0A3N4IGJ3_ASCIM|nr:hypothetical protein BJ508DRAFT_20308 [Ascobolus immersus RN42]